MLPFETRLALFPRRSLDVRIGLFRRLRLRPITLERAAVMEMFNCGMLDGEVGKSQALVAAWILSADDKDVRLIVEGKRGGAKRFIRSLSRKVDVVHRAVNILVGEAIIPFIPPKKDENGAVEVDDGIPKGNGWPLEIAEALCANYGWSFEYAMKIEVQTALALVAVCRQRCGGAAGGPDYFDRIRQDRWEKDGTITPKRKAAPDGR